ncbi:hypothetical protein AVEN_233421-1 [Araneus ventricosus]|uniref:Uncharacterized protein n=1 Tax=Araneus ventricosus TaxID=182803 RepID=A0A4Y2IXJ4_ARAVE|nr:hypothetical protein AVEN_233421-1 [Araneus ventricosus]
MVYGCTFRLPGEFFRNSWNNKYFSGSNFLQQLHPTPLSAHGTDRSTFISKDLMSSSQIFVQIDSVLRPLQQPYQGPFQVISRTDKFSLIDFNGRKTNISLDRLKPAYILKQEASESSVQSSETATRSGCKVRFVLPYQA